MANAYQFLKFVSRNLLVVIALTGLLSSQIQLQNWHALLDITELHGEIEESDPCHLAIYHFSSNDQKNCVHRSHISRHHHHCELCKISHSSLVISFELGASNLLIVPFFESERLITLAAAELKSNSFKWQSRGPPQNA
jgi:hypothetical protein